MTRKKTSPIFTKFWGSSHCAPHHGLPENLHHIFKSQHRFAPPQFDAKSGRCISQNIVSKIINEISFHHSNNNRQLHFIILGSNNLSQDHDLHYIEGLFESILQHSQQLKGIHIVLAGIMPRFEPGVNNSFKAKFAEMNDLIRNLTIKYRVNGG